MTSNKGRVPGDTQRFPAIEWRPCLCRFRFSNDDDDDDKLDPHRVSLYDHILYFILFEKPLN